MASDRERLNTLRKKKERLKALRGRQEKYGNTGPRVVEDDGLGSIRTDESLAKDVTDKIGDSFLKKAGETIKDVVYSGGQAMALEFGDEILGGVVAAYKSLSNDERSFADIYMDARDDARSEITAARERSPVFTFIGDMVAPNPLAAISKFKKLGMLAQGAASGLAEGIGSGTGDSSEVISSGVAGAIFGSALPAAGSLLSKGFKDSGKLRATAMGLTRPPISEVSKGAKLAKKIDVISDRLYKKNFFGAGSNEFNTATRKYDGSKAGVFKGNATTYDMAERIENGIRSSSNRIDDLLSNERIRLKDGKLVNQFDAIEDFAANNSIGRMKNETIEQFDRRNAEHLREIAASHSEELGFTMEQMRNFTIKGKNGEYSDIQDITESLHSLPNINKDVSSNLIEESLDMVSSRGFVSVHDMQKEKKRIYELVNNNYGKDNFTDTEKVTLKALGGYYKRLMERVLETKAIYNIKDKSLKTKAELVIKHNQDISDLMFFRDGVYEKVFGEKTSRTAIDRGVRSTFSSITTAAKGVGGLEEVLDKTRLKRADIGDSVKKIYENANPIVKSLLEKTYRDFGARYYGASKSNEEAGIAKNKDLKSRIKNRGK